MNPDEMHEILTVQARGRRIARVGGWGWVCAAAASCGDGNPRNADRLSSLSTTQLAALCDELPTALAGERPLLECDSGRTLFLDEVGLAACGSQTTTCSASVGQWFACMASLFGDACEAEAREPEACSALRSAPGCSEIALPIDSVCTPPTSEYVRAFDGVYEIVDMTLNDAGCDAGGTLRAGQGHIVLASGSFPGVPLAPLQDTPMLMLQLCSGVDACREHMAGVLAASEPFHALTSVELPSFGVPDLPEDFVCAPDASGALITSSINLIGGAGCVFTISETALRLEPDGFIRLTIEHFDLPSRGDGDACTFPRGDEDSRRCVSSEVLRARRVAEL
jgi:hypothetical protein